MRKSFFAVIAVLLCSLFVLGGCSNTPEENRVYKFENASFVHDKDLTIEDVASFTPALVTGEKIETVNELEKYILDNIDEYTVIFRESGGSRRVNLKNRIESIVLGKDKITLTCDGKSKDYEFSLDGGKYVIADSDDDKCKV